MNTQIILILTDLQNYFVFTKIRIQLINHIQEAISSTIKLNNEGLVLGLLDFLQNDKKIKVNSKIAPSLHL